MNDCKPVATERRPYAIYLPVLKELCKALDHHLLQNRNIVIKGHTDSGGKAEYNMELSLKRAGAVREYLKKCRISGLRLKIIGCGEKISIADNATPVGRQKNRRVEILVDEDSSGAAEQYGIGRQFED